MQCVTRTLLAAEGGHLSAPHRTSPSGKSGVLVGLFSRNSPPDRFFQNARPSGLCPSGGAPKQPFGLFRCSAWLLLTTHRTSRSGCSGVPHGLFSMNSPPDCSFRNAHAPGLRPSVCQSTGLVIPQTLDLQGFAPPQKGRLDPHARRFVDKRKVFHAGRRERISSEARNLSVLCIPRTT